MNQSKVANILLEEINNELCEYNNNSLKYNYDLLKALKFMHALKYTERCILDGYAKRYYSKYKSIYNAYCSYPCNICNFNRESYYQETMRNKTKNLYKSKIKNLLYKSEHLWQLRDTFSRNKINKMIKKVNLKIDNNTDLSDQNGIFISIIIFFLLLNIIQYYI